MMNGRPKKYMDFVEGAPVNEPSHLSSRYGRRDYVPITCPHCGVVFVKIPLDQIFKTKASKCLRHLRVCPKFKGEVASKAPTSELEKMKAELAEFRASQSCMQSNISRMWGMLGGSDPKPTSLIELSARAPEQIRQIGKKRKFELHGWDDRSIKLFRVFTHPDKDRLYCPRANAIRAWLREETMGQTGSI